MTAGHKSYLLVADNEAEYKDWLNKLSSVLQQNKLQEEKRAASLERGMYGDKNLFISLLHVFCFSSLNAILKAISEMFLR